MKTRRLLPDGLGVCWSDGSTEVVWAYCDGRIDVDAEAGVERLDGGQAVPVEHGATLAVRGGSVYRIQP